MRKIKALPNILQFSFLGLIILVSALLLGPMKAEADRRADGIKVQIIARLEENLGVRISYRSISPALLSVVTIRDLAVEFDQGEFRADRLRVFYNPLKQFSGNRDDPARMISRLQVSTGILQLAIEPVDDGGLDDAEREKAASGPDLELLNFLLDKTIVLLDISTDISAPGFTNLDSLVERVEVRYDGEAVRYDLSVVGSFELTELSDLGELEVAVASGGRFSPADMSLNGRVDILRADTALLQVKPTALDVTFSESTLVARRIGDDKAVDLSGTVSRGQWSVDGEASRLPLSELAVPVGAMERFAPWFNSRLDGTFSVRSGGPEQNLGYSIDIALAGPGGTGPAGLAGRIRADGDSRIANIGDLMVSADAGRIDFNGQFMIDELMPVGQLGVQLSEELAGYPMSASFRTSYSNRTLVATPETVNAGDMVFEDFSFLLIREDTVMTASLLAIPLDDGSQQNRRIVVDALLELGDTPVLHSFVTLDGVNATIPARLAGISGADSLPVLNDAVLDFRGFYESNPSAWVINIDDASVTSISNPENGVTFSGRVFPDRWALDSLHLSWNGYDADGRVFAVSSPSGGAAEGKFLVGEDIIPVSGEWHSDGRMSIYSENGLSFNLGNRTGSGRSMLVRAEGLVIPLKEGELRTELDLRGIMTPDSWEIYLNQADLELIQGDYSTLFSTTGVISPGNISLSRIAIQDEAGVLTGNAAFTSFSSGRYLNGRGVLSSPSGESYQVTIAREDNDWNIDIDIDSARLSRVSRERLGGEADLTANLSGDISNPVVELKLESSTGMLDDAPFTARATANLRNRSLRVQDLLFDHEGISLNRGIVLFDMNSGSLRSTADLDTTFNQVPVATGFSLAVDLGRGIDFDELGTVTSGDITGTLATRPVVWATKEHLPEFTFHFARKDGVSEVLTPDGTTLNLRHDVQSGSFNVSSAAPLPVVVQGGGTIGNGSMDLSFPVFGFDPQLINYVMLRDPILLEYHVIFQDGFFDGSLDIRGPTGDPDMYGTISAVDLKVDTPYTYSGIKPTGTDVHFNGNRITVDRLEVPIGDGYVYGEGYVVLDRWSITEFNMVYGGAADGRGGGVPVYYPLLGIMIDGLFTGEVNLTSDGRAWALTGDLMFPMLKASLGAAVVPVSQRKEGRLPKPFSLNLNLTTGNNVTFFLPNEQLKIVRATASPGETLNLQLTTVPKVLSMTGELPVKSGNIYYFDRDFQMTEGVMTFNESLGSFDPILSLRAETRVRDSDDEEVTVALVYDAPVKSGFNPTVETIPARTEYEILELFGQAVVPYADAEEADSSTVLLATGSVFAQAGIVQPFEEVLREGLNLDMVTLQTDIIENTLAEGLDRESDSPITGSSLGRYLDNTSLYAGKYIGDALFLSGSVSANYFEEQRNQSVFGGLKFSPSVALEMETPFFNVAWSYSPDPAVNRNFVEDNEISLKWQYSF